MTVVRLRLTPVGETRFPLAYGPYVSKWSRGLAAPHTPLHTVMRTRARA
jgi:hypothetical protein